MSAWTHPMCEACWRVARGDDVLPVRFMPGFAVEVCCWCGAPTTSGIYTREDPAVLPAHTPHD